MIEHHLAVTRTARYYTVGGSDGAGEDANAVRELFRILKV